MAAIQGEVIRNSYKVDFVNGQAKPLTYGLGVVACWVEIRKADKKLIHAFNWDAGADPNNDIIIDDLGADYAGATVFVTGIIGQQLNQTADVLIH